MSKNFLEVLSRCEQRTSQINNTALKKVSGNVPGMDRLSEGRTSRSSQAPLTNVSSKHSTNALQFPLDVLSDTGLGNHGHYIMFYINKQIDAELTSSKVDQNEKGSVADDASQQYSRPKYLREWQEVNQSYEKRLATDKDRAKQFNEYEVVGSKSVGRDEFEGVRKVLIKQPKSSRFGGSTIKLTRKPTRRLTTGIAMFMPAQVQVTYTSNYTDTQIGGGTEDILNAFNQAGANDLEGAIRSALSVDDAIAEGLTKAALATVGALPIGLQGLREGAEAKAGAIISDRLELAFKGINKRQFQYTFKMIPRSQAEADEIRKIIFTFKQNMLPEFVGGNRQGRRLRVPNTFDIQYMYKLHTNEYLHHISTCVLETMNVQYGGDRYKTFEAIEGEGAPPVETSITLNFKEMELITRERVFEGF